MFTILGVIAAAVGLKCFLLPNHFIDGGITGISMLLANLTDVPLGIWLIVVNIPFVISADRLIGRMFAIQSGMAIIGLAIAIAFLPLPSLTSDKLLGAVFGGFFVGAGVGIAIRSGGVLDGTEILAVILSARTFATVGEVILVLNVAIFSIAAVFLGIEPALYSMLTYLAASKTIDYLLHGIEAYNGVMILTAERDAIRDAILQELGRGVTNFKTLGGYSGNEQELLFCVVTRLEITRLETIIRRNDPKAFVVTLPVLDAKGGVVKRRSVTSQHH
ncbi:MAG: YitT family protein [Pirellula sp.]